MKTKTEKTKPAPKQPLERAGKGKYASDNESWPKVPAFRLSRQMVRYHPRTVLAKMARDAGVPMDLIAASFGITQNKN